MKNIGKTIDIRDLNVGDSVIVEIPSILRIKSVYEGCQHDDFLLGTYTYLNATIDDEMSPAHVSCIINIFGDASDCGWFGNCTDDLGFYTVKAKKGGKQGYDRNSLYIENYIDDVWDRYPVRFCEFSDEMITINALVKSILSKKVRELNHEVDSYISKFGVAGWNTTLEADGFYNERIRDKAGLTSEESEMFKCFYGEPMCGYLFKRLKQVEGKF